MSMGYLFRGLIASRSLHFRHVVCNVYEISHTDSPTAMARSSTDVTDAELAVLGVLWDREKATVRQIAEALYPRCTSSEHATVQKLLDRLRGKLCVERDASVWPHQFSASIDREHLIGHRLENVARTLCGGSLPSLLTHLVRTAKLSPKEKRNLRALLNESDKK